MEFKGINRFDPMVKPVTINAMVTYYGQVKIVYRCLRAGVFDCLSLEPKTAERISEENNFISSRLEVTLNALVGIGLVEKKYGRFALTQESYTYLCSRSVFYCGDTFRYSVEPICIDDRQDLRSWLLGEVPSGEHDPIKVFSNEFIHYSAQSAILSNAIYQVADILSTHPCFAKAKTLLDVGGGHGLFTIALKKRNPNLSAAVFDLPQTEPVTKMYADACDEEIGFIPGNFYTSEIPGNQDIVLCCDIMYPVSAERKRQVFTKIYHALNQEGYFFLKLMYLNEDRTLPQRISGMALNGRMSSEEGYVFTLEEAKSVLTQIGFTVETVVEPEGNDWKVICAVKK